MAAAPSTTTTTATATTNTTSTKVVSFGDDVNGSGRAWSVASRSISPFQHDAAPVAVLVRGGAGTPPPSQSRSTVSGDTLAAQQQQQQQHHYYYLQQYPRRPVSAGSSSGRGELNASPLLETRARRASTMESDGSSQSASPFDFLNKYPAAASAETYSASSIGSAGDDRSGRSDDVSVESDRSAPVPERRRQPPSRRPTRTGYVGSSSSSGGRRHHPSSSSALSSSSSSSSTLSPSAINYHGSTMAVAASQG